jgi:hypothetical protein
VVTVVLVTTYAANSYASQAYRLRQYSTVCRLMMIEMIETCCGTNIGGGGEEELLR